MAVKIWTERVAIPICEAGERDKNRHMEPMRANVTGLYIICSRSNHTAGYHPIGFFELHGLVGFPPPAYCRFAGKRPL